MTKTTHSRALAMSVTMAAAAVVALMMSILLPQEVNAQETCQNTNGGFHVCISKTASPNPVKKGKPLTFTIKVTNTCTPEDPCSFGDSITDFLPTGTRFVSGSFTAPSGSGSCTEESARTVTCGSFSLEPGESATATIRVTPTKRGRFTNNAVEHAFNTLATADYRVK